MANDLAAWASVLVATGSLVVAIIALIKSGRAQHRATDAQQRIVKIEEQREQNRRAQALQAILRPELRKTGRNSDRLYIVNQGAAEARNIRVEMDGKPLAEHPAAVRNDPMPDFVGPDSEIGCLLAFHMQCTPPFDLKITWDDDSGKDRIYRTTLTW